jgi:mannose-1-phosphate guanylyltransferase
MRVGVEFVLSSNAVATFGIKTIRPETNYGYVKASPENLGTHDAPLFRVEKFIEKPDRERAEHFFYDPLYYWNSGMFLWKVSTIQELIAKHLPDLWKSLNEIKAETDREIIREKYAKLQRISIDFGVMEKADNVVVIPASFAWDDVGTWNSLLRILTPNEEGNLVQGQHVSLDTTDSIIYSENGLVATAGLNDVIVVQKNGRTLVCTRHYADRLKELLAKLPK